jgi:selenocysteine-specific elongation factor
MSRFSVPRRVRLEEVGRGDVLTTVGSPLTPTYRLDAELSFGTDEPQAGDRVTVHHGTRETPARLAWLGGRFWQLRCESPLLALRGDRLVIRSIAPPDTLGGGTGLDPRARKHGPGRELLARLARLSRGEPDEPPRPEPVAAVRPHRPPAPLTPSARALAGALLAARFAPPLDAELSAGDLAALREHGLAVRVSRTLHYHADVLAEVRARVIGLAAAGDGSVTLAQLRDELGTSRKFAQALLEHLDAERVTVRRGEAHVVRASARRGNPADAPPQRAPLD